MSVSTFRIYVSHFCSNDTRAHSVVLNVAEPEIMEEQEAAVKLQLLKDRQKGKGNNCLTFNSICFNTPSDSERFGT